MKLNLKKENIGFYLSAIFLGIVFGGYRFTNMMSDWVGYENYITHNYQRPFVTRALIPYIVEQLHKFNISPEFLFQSFEVIATILCIIFFEKLLSYFIHNKFYTQVMANALIIMAPFLLILPRLINLWYPYDIFSLLFNILLIIFLYKENYLLYYPLFIIATINRESTFFVTFAMLFIYFKNYTHKKLFLHIAAQFFIWLTIVKTMDRLLTHEEGYYFEFLLMKNFGFIKDIFTAQGITGGSIGRSVFQVASFFHALSFLFITVIVVQNWKLLDQLFLRRLFFTSIPFYFVVFVRTNAYEYRLIAEFLPFVFLPGAYVIYQRIMSAAKN